MDPLFLTLDEVTRVHRQQIEQHGGSPGLLNPGLLDSALAQPPSSFGGQFAHADLAEMAAAYLFHLAKNHCFVDGNKRVAALAAVIFLGMNRVDIVLPQDGYYDLAYAVAAGTADKAAAAAGTANKAAAAAFFRRYWPAGA